MKNAPSLVFTMTGANGLIGGIAAANLNILYAVSDLATETGLNLSVFSFLEQDGHRPDFLPNHVSFRAFSGDKLGLTAALMGAAFKKPRRYFLARLSIFS